MRTIEIKLYSFDELSEDAKQNAINNLQDINLHHDWYEHIYYNAQNIGIKINGFDIDRGSYCEIENFNDWHIVAEKIIEEHGETCETYKIAEAFLKERDEIIDTAERDENGDFSDEYQVDCELDDLEENFKNDLSECYLNILRHEYEYLSSEDAIIETIKANEYDFTEEGKIY